MTQELGVVFRLRDEASKKLDGIAGKFAANRQKIGAALTGVAAIGILAGKKESWDDQKDKILAVTAALQKKTNFGDEEQIRTLAILTTALGSSEKALAALPAVLDLATINQQGLVEASRSLGPVLTGVTNSVRGTSIRFEESAGFAERLAIILADVAGTAEANANPMTQLGNTIGDVSEKIGFALLPTLIPLAEKLGEMAVKVQDWMVENQKLMRILAPIVIALIAMAAIIGPILLLLPLFAGGIAIVKAAFIAMNLSMGTVALVILGIAAAITAGIIIWKNWDAIMGVIRASFDKVKLVFMNVVGVLERLYKSKLGWLLPGGPLIKAILFLKDNWAEVWDGMVTVVRTVWDTIKGIVQGVLDTVMGPIKLLLETMEKIVGLAGKVTGLAGKIPGGGLIAGTAGKIGGALKGFAGFAEGGIVTRPTLGLIGERGPEAVIPLNRAGSGGLGGVTVIVNMPRNGTVIMDRESTAKALGKEIMRLVRTELRSQRAF
jgi:hypothetical protein